MDFLKAIYKAFKLILVLKTKVKTKTDFVNLFY